jgi:hypothetical protein
LMINGVLFFALQIRIGMTSAGSSHVRSSVLILWSRIED